MANIQSLKSYPLVDAVKFHKVSKALFMSSVAMMSRRPSSMARPLMPASTATMKEAFNQLSTMDWGISEDALPDVFGMSSDD